MWLNAAIVNIITSKNFLFLILHTVQNKKKEIKRQEEYLNIKDN